MSPRQAPGSSPSAGQVRTATSSPPSPSRSAATQFSRSSPGGTATAYSSSPRSWRSSTASGEKVGVAVGECGVGNGSIATPPAPPGRTRFQPAPRHLPWPSPAPSRHPPFAPPPPSRSVLPQSGRDGGFHKEEGGLLSAQVVDHTVGLDHQAVALLAGGVSVERNALLLTVVVGIGGGGGGQCGSRWEGSRREKADRI